VVPVAITGSENALGELLKLRRPKMTVRFGEPFVIPEVEPRTRSKALHDWTEILMQKIATLLPNNYRGIYADPET
jgi:1-acyl-sn-glycerol-3-phosphate acyltransferase